MQDHLTISNAAKALSVSTDTIRRRIRAGVLPAVQDNGQWWVPTQAIQSHMQMPTQGRQDAYATPMQAASDEHEWLRAELDKARDEATTANRELAAARTDATVAQAELRRLENHLADLQHQLELRADEIKRRDTIDIQQMVALTQRVERVDKMIEVWRAETQHTTRPWWKKLLG